jgi:hypothetical protein
MEIGDLFYYKDYFDGSHNLFCYEVKHPKNNGEGILHSGDEYGNVYHLPSRYVITEVFWTSDPVEAFISCMRGKI